MVFQMNPFLEDEGKDFKLLSKRFNENKIIKAIRSEQRVHTFVAQHVKYPSLLVHQVR